MAKRGGKPLGNKRQREQAKARKKRDKEARRARKDLGLDENAEGGDPEQGSEGPAEVSEGGEAPAEAPADAPEIKSEQEGRSFPT